jgi:hypothetical protein
MRLQVLELPALGYVPRFVLILDDVPAEAVHDTAKPFNEKAKEMGAVGGFVFSEQVEIL